MRITTLVTFLAAAACSEASADLETTTSGDLAGEINQLREALTAQLADLEEDLAASSDQVALQRLADCYGRGHDLVFFDLGGSQQAAREALEACFASDVTSEFRFFGAPEGEVLNGLPALIGFIEQFAIDSGYNTARNIPGNVNIQLTGPDTAIVTYSGNTPHFSFAPSDPEQPGFVEWFSARYTSQAVRSEDGVWRTTVFDIEIDEVVRQDIGFPFGQ